MRLAVFFGLFLLCSANAVRFGMAGHQIIASMATKLLTPEALAEVNRLLALPFEQPPPPAPRPAPAAGAAPAAPATPPPPPPKAPQGCLLCDQANWADFIKFAPNYASTAKLHVSDGPDWNCKYQRSRDCVGGNCVEQAIGRYAALLANTKTDDKQRADAVRFITHFIGDIHQPLHVAFASDQGGNLIKGTIVGEPGPVSLHLIWDYVLINQKANKQYGNDAARYAQALLGGVRKTFATCNQKFSICSEKWAMESANLACSHAYVAADGKTKLTNGFALDAAYIKRNTPIAEQQMQKAAARLAAVLNSALGRSKIIKPKVMKPTRVKPTKPTSNKPARKTANKPRSTNKRR